MIMCGGRIYRGTERIECADLYASPVAVQCAAWTDDTGRDTEAFFHLGLATMVERTNSVNGEAPRYEEILLGYTLSIGRIALPLETLRLMDGDTYSAQILTEVLGYRIRAALRARFPAYPYIVRAVRGHTQTWRRAYAIMGPHDDQYIPISSDEWANLCLWREYGVVHITEEANHAWI